VARLPADLRLALHLRPGQILHRPRRLIAPRLLATGIPDDPPVRWRPLAAGLGVDPAPQSGPVPPPHEAGVFEALGLRRAADAPGLWAAGDDGLLLAFTLHGFTELARYAAGPPSPGGDAFWAGVLRSWLDACDEPAEPAWHPFPLSLRLTSWMAALSRPGWPADLHARALTSAARQLRYLRRSVEHDIGGNHVLRNGCALVMAGACLGDERSERAGLTLLRRELARQILSDGGHEERSPSYHRDVLAALADVAETLRRAHREIPGWLDATVGRMTEWLSALALPDGSLPLVNDAWEGPPVVPATGDVDLPASGFVVFRDGEDALVLQAGPIAPAHLPAHAHAHALSIVAAFDGRPVVVDPGVGAYTGPARDRYRSTAAHSTVGVDSRDQCELIGPFRAVGLPDVRVIDRWSEGTARLVRAVHDGYAPVRHERTVVWLPGSGAVIADRLLAGGPHRIRSALVLHPAATATEASPVTIAALGPFPARDEPATYSPAFGREVATGTRILEGLAAPGQRFGWALLREGASARLDGDRLVIDGPAGEMVEIRLPG